MSGHRRRSVPSRKLQPVTIRNQAPVLDAQVHYTQIRSGTLHILMPVGAVLQAEDGGYREGLAVHLRGALAPAPQVLVQRVRGGLLGLALLVHLVVVEEVRQRGRVAVVVQHGVHSGITQNEDPEVY